MSAVCCGKQAAKLRFQAADLHLGMLMHATVALNKTSIQGDKSCKSNNMENTFTPPKNIKKRISSSSAAVEISGYFAKHENGRKFIYSVI